MDNGRGGVLLARTLREVFQGTKDQSWIRRVPAKAESGDRKYSFDLRDLVQNRFHMAAGIRSVLERCTFWSLHRDDEVPCVFLRNKAFRYMLIDPVSQPETRPK